MTEKQGVLFIVSGPSGTGKGTIMDEYFKKYPEDNSFLSISMTSRAPRATDTEGVTYYFKSREEFEDLIKNDGLAEWTEFCGNYYGTPKKPVNDMLSAGRNVVLEIEVEGYHQVKNSFKDAIGVFVLPPSLAELRNRLKGRNTETDEVIEKRINRAYEEIKEVNSYDYLLINDDLDRAVDDFHSIVLGEGLKVKRNQKFIDEVYKKC